MKEWLAVLIKAILPAVSSRVTNVIAYWLGKKSGEAAQRAKQDEADLETLHKAASARRAVTDDGVLDKYNRDKTEG